MIERVKVQGALVQYLSAGDVVRMHVARTRELILLCEQMGFFATQATHFVVR